MSPSAAPRARLLRIAALALLPMLVLSACGGDDDDDNGSSSRTPGDTYAITTGEPMGHPGGTNMLKVCRVG